MFLALPIMIDILDAILNKASDSHDEPHHNDDDDDEQVFIITINNFSIGSNSYDNNYDS